jgi:hypothetical protein
MQNALIHCRGQGLAGDPPTQLRRGVGPADPAGRRFALDYVTRGWRTLPVRRDKHPLTVHGDPPCRHESTSGAAHDAAAGRP